MNFSRPHGNAAIVGSLALAMLLTIIPLSEVLARLRPDWVGLTLIFWCLMLPHRIGVGWGFITGLLLDVLSGTLLGQHALALTLVAYVCVRLHARIRAYPAWQQMLTILLLLTLHQLVVLWVDRTIGRPEQGFSYWLPSLIGMLLWHPMQRWLEALRRGFGVQ